MAYMPTNGLANLGIGGLATGGQIGSQQQSTDPWANYGTAANPTPGQQRQAAGTTPAGEVPPPDANAGVVYTDSSGKGYNPGELANAWQDPNFRSNPLNARVGDILTQYGAQPGQTPQAPQAPQGGGQAAPTAVNQPFPTAGPMQRDPRSDQLFNILMGRAQQSLSVNPMTDPVLKPQLDAAAANAERANRSYMSQAAEHAGSNGNMDAVGRSLAEHAAQGNSTLAAQLGQNELNARREEVQNALTGMGQQLTAQQQMDLQHELGLIDAQLKQYGLNNQNDQFYSNLGLEAEDRGNYWDSLRKGLLG